MLYLTRNRGPNARFATVLVGPEKTRFVVHQDLIAHHSDFFKAALTGNFKEAAEKTVALTEEDPVFFEFFVHWLYYQKLPTKDDADVNLLGQWMNEDDYGDLETDNLIVLHILADKYGVAKLKRDTTDGLLDHIETGNGFFPSATQISDAYKSLPRNSALLKLLVDLVCRFPGSVDWEDDFPLPFVRAVLKLFSAEGCLYSERLDECDYHDRKAGEKKCSC